MTYTLRNQLVLLSKQVDGMIDDNHKHRDCKICKESRYLKGFHAGREFVLAMMRDDIKNILSRIYNNEYKTIESSDRSIESSTQKEI